MSEVPEPSYGYEDAKTKVKFMFVPNLAAYFLIIFLTIHVFTKVELAVSIPYSVMMAIPVTLVDAFYRYKRVKDTYRELRRFVSSLPGRVLKWGFIGLSNPLISVQMDEGVKLVAQGTSMWLTKGGVRAGRPEKFRGKMRMRIMFSESLAKIDLSVRKERGLLGCVGSKGYVEVGRGYIELPSPGERVVERLRDALIVEVSGIRTPYYLLSEGCVELVVKTARRFFSTSS